MKILIDINHPADVHQFRHVITLLKKRNKVLVVARKRDCIHALLRAFHIPFTARKGYVGAFSKLAGMVKIDWQLYKIAKRFLPDVLVGSSGNIYIAQVAKCIRKPSLIFDDTEHAKIQKWFCFPFATKIITPETYKLSLGKKQITYPGTKENGYLDRRYFRPNPHVQKILGKKNTIVLRLVSWDASHDMGLSGLPRIRSFVKDLEKLGKVIVSSERKLPEGFGNHMHTLPPEDLHSLLYYASLIISEGATTAVEGALLSTPTIYTNPLTMGYLEPFVKNESISHITKRKDILTHAARMLTNGKRKILPRHRFDLNKFMVEVIQRC